VGSGAHACWDVELIRRLQARKAMTSEELASKAGVSLRTLKRLFAGRPVYPSSIRRIARVFGLEAGQLARREEDL